MFFGNVYQSRENVTMSHLEKSSGIDRAVTSQATRSHWVPWDGHQNRQTEEEMVGRPGPVLIGVTGASPQG